MLLAFDAFALFLSLQTVLFRSIPAKLRGLRR